ncbi:MAG: hypothetical protein HKL80_02430 [Acidimicrobiales bacterium]|nr:hypothetical protein [Acidimicrobiales bacterium]
MLIARSETLGPAARPVAIPEDLEYARTVKASGKIELPFHIKWSGTTLIYDLDNRVERARVYEQVLREGTEEDIRYYIEIDKLLDLWNDLVLPIAVRKAWMDWLGRHKISGFTC